LFTVFLAPALLDTLKTSLFPSEQGVKITSEEALTGAAEATDLFDTAATTGSGLTISLLVSSLN